MKRLILLFVIVPFMVQARDITGQWSGLLKMPGMEVRLVVLAFNGGKDVQMALENLVLIEKAIRPGGMTM